MLFPFSLWLLAVVVAVLTPILGFAELNAYLLGGHDLENLYAPLGNNAVS